MAVIVLLGHWVDFFNMVMPGTVGPFWSIGLLEIGALPSMSRRSPSGPSGHCEVRERAVEKMKSDEGEAVSPATTMLRKEKR